MGWSGGSDTRRVQTAVVGDEHSDVPVVLPFEAIEVDAFQKANPGATYWCGVLLGGCGARLSIKTYVDRACHFAHIPPREGPPRPCLRTATNHASADHLYIKAQLSEWLAGQGMPVRAGFPETGHRVGAVVKVAVVDGVRLWVHLSEKVPPHWPAEAPGERRQEVVLGPGVTASPQRLTEQRYVHRVRCDSEGSGRRVLLGTQTLGYGIRWFDLSECRMTEGGLVTPAVEQILADRRAAAAAAAERAQESVTPTGSTAAKARSETATAVPHVTGSPRVEGLRRRLEEARKAGQVRVVQELYRTAEQLAATPLETASAQVLREVLAQTAQWLAEASQPTHRERVFRVLRHASRVRDYRALRATLPLARAACRPGVTPQEAADLARAEQLLATRPSTAPLPRPRRTAHQLVASPKKPARQAQTGEPARAKKRGTAGTATPQPGRLKKAVARQAAPDPRSAKLAAQLRSALEEEDLAAVRALVDEASAPGFPLDGRAAGELRRALADARQRLENPEAHAAIIASRQLLADLSRHGHAMTPGQLAAACAQMEEHAVAAGRLLPPYHRSALTSWRARLAAHPTPPDPVAARISAEQPPAVAGDRPAASSPVPVRRRGGARQPEHDGATAEAVRLEPVVLDRLAEVVRARLEQTARDHATTTWTRL
ncbi:MAG: hypothetical protein JO362_02980, partial [Streptomycetaceae bacterium]|nr:hypothetical protein [Streptomycetaceae bacterium]